MNTSLLAMTPQDNWSWRTNSKEAFGAKRSETWVFHWESEALTADVSAVFLFPPHLCPLSLDSARDHELVEWPPGERMLFSVAICVSATVGASVTSVLKAFALDP